MSNKNILVITDKVNCTWLDLDTKNYSKSYNFDILNLGFNGEATSKIYKEKYSKLNSFKIIDINSYAELAQEKIRKFIPLLIYDFPRKEIIPDVSLIKLLRISSKINLWWFMLMSEKGVQKTPLIKRMYYLELIKNVISQNKYNETWLEIEDKDFLELLIVNKNKISSIKIISKKTNDAKKINRNSFWFKLLSSVFTTQAKCFARKIMLKIIGIRKTKKIPKDSILFFSFFPYFWIKSSSTGYFENFFKSVPKKVSENATTFYTVWLTFNNIFYIWKERREIKKNFNQLNILPIESYLGLKNFAYVFFLSMQYIAKTLNYRLNLKSKIKIDYEEYDITNILLADLHQSLTSSEVFDSIMMSIAINNIVSYNKVSAIIYRIEFQPHEKAIEYGTENLCTTIAFQHQAIGRNHLQYFFPRFEIDECYFDRRNPDNLPLPDKFLVSGEYPFEILKNAGIREEDIDICGPVRYQSLFKYKKEGVNKSEMRKKYGFEADQHIFLIASPSAKEDMTNFMFSLVEALKGNKEKILFLFKSHPVYKLDKDVIGIINEFYPNMNYLFLADDVNLNDYLILSDALILTATTVGLEAICLGIMPILLENNYVFSLNPLLEIRDSYLSVKNSNELREAMFSIINGDEKINEIKKHWPTAIKKLFYSIDEDPNEKFCHSLEKYGLLHIKNEK